MAEDDPVWDWSVPFDEDFVRAAATREESGQARADRASRIAQDHRRADGWRSSPTTSVRPPRDRRDWRSWFVPLATVGMVALVVLAFGPGVGLPVAEDRTSLLGDGSPALPVPADAADSPLGSPPPAPAGEGGFDVLHETGGRPVTFDPCRPLHWVLRPEGAPPGAQALLEQGFAELSRATGLVTVFDGETDEPADRDRAIVQEDRYGERYAPVLVAWADEDSDGDLAGDVGGYAGPDLVDPDGAGPRLVSGVVVLDTDTFSGERPAQQDLGIVLHELGHLVGLDHVADPADTMHPSSEAMAAYTAGALRGLAQLGRGPCFVDR